MPYAIGDQKVCSKCRVRKDLIEFHSNVFQKDGLGNQCKECARDAHRKNYYKDIAGTRTGKMSSYRRRRYGLDRDQYRALGEAVDWACPGGCGRRADSVDHDHDTGAVRGLLCRQCNLALGHAHDDPAVLRTLAAYLETTPLRPLVASIMATVRAPERVHYNAAKTHCKRGHPYDATNTRPYARKDGVVVRFCITCERERTARRVAAGEFRRAAPHIWYEE